MQAENLGKQRSVSVYREKSRVHLGSDKQPQFLIFTFSSLGAVAVDEIAWLA